MSEIKTKVTNASVTDFIDKIENDTKRQDSFVLLDLFSKISGEKAKMWGDSMIGFGQYHYKSDRSSQEGDWPIMAFSPRKQNLTLYVMPSYFDFGDLFDKLGKHKTSVGCLYINKLSDVDMKVLEQILEVSYEQGKKKFAS